ncbi:MAG: DUF58 domain-containing protein [Phycisphaeraceae bacterium]|nr:DUF58 domain-containing protein [Phycisphaeraceae bacterium]
MSERSFSEKPPILRRATRLDELIDGRLMAKLDQVDVVSRKIFQGKIQGERRSKRRGQSVEFADFRPYVHGDDLRFVDWNIYGRLDRLFLKMFLEEEDLSLLIAIDASASMDWGNPNKLEYARRLAMALGYVGLVNHNRVTLISFNGSGIRRLSNLRGRRRTSEMGRWLLQMEASGEAPFGDTMRSIALSRQGRGVMLVLSDFMVREGYERGLRYLVGRGYDLFLMQLLSPEELDPGTHGLSGDLRLEDIEDGSTAEVTVSGGLLRHYRERLDAYLAGLRDFSIRRSMTHVVIDTSTDMDVLLMEYLRRRGLLR